ncbi:MAG: PA2169 family four-helix-bundle protein [Rhodanobacteraceae bacterium]
MDTKSVNDSDAANPAAPADTATINEMIEVLNDGIAFYTEAMQDVARPDLKALFGRMASHKKQIASELAEAVRQLSDVPSASGTFAGSMRKLYAELRTRMTSDKDDEYVAQLEEFEDRILHTFEAAATDADDATVRGIATNYMSAVREDHDFMRDLKKAP